MEALPHDVRPDGAEHVTGVSCPDCHGVLAVKVLGPRRTLEFRCRVGHTYSLSEVLESQEEDREDRAWGAVAVAEEIAALLRDLVREGRIREETASPFVARQHTAQRLADAFRTALANDEPLRLPGTGEPPAGRDG